MSKLTLEDLMVPVTFKREVAKLKAADKRRWNAVPHVSRCCMGGPFDGQELACSVGVGTSGARTLPFSVACANIDDGIEWRGRYVEWVWQAEG
jgi:hypothetical protein